MIPRRNRLPVAEFKSQKTRFFKDNFFSARWAPNQLGFNRYAILISSRIIPLSVGRHTLKRRIASVLEKWPNLGVDLALSILPPAKTAQFSTISSSIEAIYVIIKKNTS
jgi:ribonuclease P protein component